MGNGYFGEKIPKRTYVSVDGKTSPGFKPARDKIRLILESNQSVDCRLNTMAINAFESHISLRGLKRSYLPVIYKEFEKKLNDQIYI
ncbi:Tigger transposable element-derived protein 1 [Smittium mucronatum]|uniref:Tigger transposable element-derived protein 1 n=1 Tax=Smittium mucronatum TaxID=133383 RepID=A0A1R0H2Z3_9FUNG|nr:Tigger transposable element-derived protein 1 [Smittium mucronatum]